jgi:superfamily II DNA/RNA helicase
MPPATLSLLRSVGGSTPLTDVEIAAKVAEVKPGESRVDAMHGGRTPEERDAVLEAFRRGDIWVLVCTDLLARGMDFPAVHLVVNYDFPQSVTDYIHRVGRTGRAGRRGRAVTFYTWQDVPVIQPVVVAMRNAGIDVPKEVLEYRKPSRDAKRDREITQVTRAPIRFAASGTEYAEREALKVRFAEENLRARRDMPLREAVRRAAHRRASKKRRKAVDRVDARRDRVAKAREHDKELLKQVFDKVQ